MKNDRERRERLKRLADECELLAAEITETSAAATSEAFPRPMLAYDVRHAAHALRRVATRLGRAAASTGEA